MPVSLLAAVSGDGWRLPAGGAFALVPLRRIKAGDPPAGERAKGPPVAPASEIFAGTDMAGVYGRGQSRLQKAAAPTGTAAVYGYLHPVTQQPGDVGRRLPNAGDHDVSVLLHPIVGA